MATKQKRRRKKRGSQANRDKFWAKEKKRYRAAKKPATDAPIKPEPPSGPGDYTLRFGKHSGQRMKNVPESYLGFLLGIDAYTDVVKQDLEKVKEYLAPTSGTGGTLGRCEICERDQVGQVCVQCGWALCQLEDDRVEMAELLTPSDW